MFSFSIKKLRYYIASTFRGKFTALYSTTDNPTEVPVQMEAYELALDKYIKSGDILLDVGFGAGHGLLKAYERGIQVHGLEVDKKAYRRFLEIIFKSNLSSKVKIDLFDGKKIPFPNESFDVLTCIDVIEHVADYLSFIQELIRVSKTCVVLSTPVRRPEFTRADGKPLNYWHLREWSYEELDLILKNIQGITIEWNFINGPFEGPFSISPAITQDSLAMVPVVFKNKN